MGKQPEETEPLIVRDFAGMVSNADGADIDAGQARVQVNVSAARRGELRVRTGWRRVRFED